MTELCHRCHTNPGTDRYYLSNQNQPHSALAGSTVKFSMKRTVGCDECWKEFQQLRQAEQ